MALVLPVRNAPLNGKLGRYYELIDEPKPTQVGRCAVRTRSPKIVLSTIMMLEDTRDTPWVVVWLIDCG